jgi:hypothetical protein
MRARRPSFERDLAKEGHDRDPDGDAHDTCRM